MLFTGEYEHVIDAKHRLAIPSDLRSKLDPEVHGSGFYLAPGPNGALWLWPEKTFELMASALGGTLLPGEEMMEFEELLFSQARHLPLDGTGRVRLPERMLHRFELGSNVTILGVKDHLELRSTEQWQALRDQKFTKQAEIMLRARQALEEQRRGGKQDGP